MSIISVFSSITYLDGVPFDIYRAISGGHYWLGRDNVAEGIGRPAATIISPYVASAFWVVEGYMHKNLVAKRVDSALSYATRDWDLGGIAFDAAFAQQDLTHLFRCFDEDLLI